MKILNGHLGSVPLVSVHKVKVTSALLFKNGHRCLIPDKGDGFIQIRLGKFRALWLELAHLDLLPLGARGNWWNHLYKGFLLGRFCCSLASQHLALITGLVPLASYLRIHQSDRAHRVPDICRMRTRIHIFDIGHTHLSILADETQTAKVERCLVHYHVLLILHSAQIFIDGFATENQFLV
jgi:hypothetical protein